MLGVSDGLKQTPPGFRDVLPAVAPSFLALPLVALLDKWEGTNKECSLRAWLQFEKRVFLPSFLLKWPKIAATLAAGILMEAGRNPSQAGERCRRGFTLPRNLFVL